jgi:hypothetical protein
MFQEESYMKPVDSFWYAVPLSDMPQKTRNKEGERFSLLSKGKAYRLPDGNFVYFTVLAGDQLLMLSTAPVEGQILGDTLEVEYMKHEPDVYQLALFLVQCTLGWAAASSKVDAFLMQSQSYQRGSLNRFTFKLRYDQEKAETEIMVSAQGEDSYLPLLPNDCGGLSSTQKDLCLTGS